MFACVLIDKTCLVTMVNGAFPVFRNLFPNCPKNTMILREICDLGSLGGVSKVDVYNRREPYL